eukprot:5482648-Pyramimonas_sp.AAC.1
MSAPGLFVSMHRKTAEQYSHSHTDRTVQSAPPGTEDRMHLTCSGCKICFLVAGRTYLVKSATSGGRE